MPYEYFFLDMVAGDWELVAANLMKHDISLSEQYLFVAGWGENLDNLGCSRNGGFVDSIYLDKQDRGRMILKVFCDFKTSWVYSDGNPPYNVQSYNNKPFGETGLWVIFKLE